jgi:hypothetical protein
MNPVGIYFINEIEVFLFVGNASATNNYEEYSATTKYDDTCNRRSSRVGEKEAKTIDLSPLKLYLPECTHVE